MKTHITGVLLVAVVWAGMVHADIIYSEGFDDVPSSGNGNPVGTYGWYAHKGDDGQNSLYWDPNPLNVTQGQQLRVVVDAAAPTTPNRIYSYFKPANEVLMWTDEAGALDLALYADLSLSWYTRNDDTGNVTRAVVAVFDGDDTRWFASDPGVGNVGSWVQNSADLSQDIWVEFAFTGTPTGDSSAFSVSGTPGALPSGTLTSVGIYMHLLDSKSTRLDSVSLDGVLVPEPATLGLMALGSVALLRRRRR